MCSGRVVYMLQSCPVDEAVFLLKPILSAETWVGDKLQQNSELDSESKK